MCRVDDMVLGLKDRQRYRSPGWPAKADVSTVLIPSLIIGLV